MIVAALNHLLENAAWARARLIPFAGRRALFDCPPLTFAFEITTEGRLAPVDASNAPDVVIRLPADAAFKLPQGLDKLISEASVEGNAEFATTLSFVFRNLRWDVEEDLARIFGDIAAHRLMQIASLCADWQHRTLARLAENVAEYLVHEKGLLPDKQALLAFREGIARLSNDLARLEGRLASLRR